MAQICQREGAVWLENVKKEILVLVGSAFVFSFFFDNSKSRVSRLVCGQIEEVVPMGERDSKI